MKQEKMYCFRMYRVDDDTCVFESENVKEYRLKEFINAYWEFFLKELFYYRIDEVGTITRI